MDYLSDKSKKYLCRFKRFYEKSNFVMKHLIKLAIVMVPIIILLQLFFIKLEFSIDKEYKIGNTKIPSIESVVGNRRVTSKYITIGAQIYKYRGAKNPKEDLEKYANYLIEKYGFREVDFYGGKRLLREEPENKLVIVVEMKADSKGYEVRIGKLNNK